MIQQAEQEGTYCNEAEGEAEKLDIQYPTGWRLWLINLALFIGGFLISLDGTLLGQSVPVISTDFHSLGDIGWYSSVYFMTLSTPQLLFNKLNERYPIRWNYAASMLIFALGSAICGAAPNSPTLIFGRATAGLGAAALLVTTSAYLPFLAPPSKRPLWIGVFAASMGLGSSSAPLIAGALTERVSWRWNASGFFYLNLPIIACTSGLFLLLVPPRTLDAPAGWKDFLKSLDLVGFATLTPSVVCLLLALQIGGNTHEWNDGRIIALLILSVVLAIGFAASERWQGDMAIVPARILKQRNVIAAVFYTFCTNGASVTTMYYLPIWFQGAKDFGPLQAGIATLPLLLSTVTGSFLSGLLNTLFGHTGLLMIAGSVLTTVGAGVLTTLDINAGSGKWIGYQIIYGLGSGISRQTPTVCVQQALEPGDVPTGYTVVTFMTFLAPSIVVSVAQAVFANILTADLGHLHIPQIDPATALAGGIKTITDGLSGEVRNSALEAVNDATIHAWRVCLVLCGISTIGALAVDHRKTRVTRKD
ncbi:MFS general substrate transporter [Thozetella sp. PMI_491]|nr:MFS general substrate transporter [Thozetella sp. PMI_491]